MMQLFIRTHVGTIITIDIEKEKTVNDLKFKIEDKSQVPSINQRLWFENKQLEDDKFINDYGIINHCTIHLHLRL